MQYDYQQISATRMCSTSGSLFIPLPWFTDPNQRCRFHSICSLFRAVSPHFILFLYSSSYQISHETQDAQIFEESMRALDEAYNRLTVSAISLIRNRYISLIVYRYCFLCLYSFHLRSIFSPYCCPSIEPIAVIQTFLKERVLLFGTTSICHFVSSRLITI